MTRLRIIPFFLPPRSCEPLCLFCHPLAGMPEEQWPRIPTPTEVLDRLKLESELLPGGTMPTHVELAWYGGLLSWPESVRFPLLQAGAEAVNRGWATQMRLALRPDQVYMLGQSLPSTRVLWSMGLRVVELEVASACASALTRMSPSHGLELLSDAIRTLRAELPEVRIGLTIRVGMPGSYKEAELRGAQLVAALQPDFVRLHPVLVLSDTWLEQEMIQGRYQPLTLEQAIELSRMWMQTLQRAGIPVVRIGLQPVRDLHLKPGRVVGGPFHPSIRSLIDAESLMEQAEHALRGRILVGQKVVLGVSPASEGALRGPENQNLTRLKRRYRCASVEVQVDPSLARGNVVLLAP